MREGIFEGKSEEEALLKASEEFGVNISDMKWEVVEENTGLFGLFGKSVKLKVQVSDKPAQMVYRTATEQSPSSIEQQNGMVKPEGQAAAPKAPIVKGPEAEAALRGLFERMGVDAEIVVSESDEQVLLNIKAKDRDTVVGRNGEVLAALQFVVNKMVNRFAESRKLVVLDAEGFRDQREEQLSQMAIRLGEKAIQTGKVIRLSPMSAQDRRLVHLALKDHEGVTTRSEGEGAFRRLLIVPASAHRQSRQRHRGPRTGLRQRRPPRRGRDSSQRERSP